MAGAAVRATHPHSDPRIHLHDPREEGKVQLSVLLRLRITSGVKQISYPGYVLADRNDKTRIFIDRQDMLHSNTARAISPHTDFATGTKE
jgi:hypothetical protein